MAVNLVVPWYANLNDCEDKSTIHGWTLPDQEQSLNISLFKCKSTTKINKFYNKNRDKVCGLPFKRIASASCRLILP